MLLLIVAPLMLGMIADPVGLVGFNADRFMLLLIVAPPMPTSIVDSTRTHGDRHRSAGVHAC